MNSFKTWHRHPEAEVAKTSRTSQRRNSSGARGTRSSRRMSEPTSSRTTSSGRRRATKYCRPRQLLRQRHQQQHQQQPQQRKSTRKRSTLCRLRRSENTAPCYFEKSSNKIKNSRVQNLKKTRGWRTRATTTTTRRRFSAGCGPPKPRERFTEKRGHSLEVRRERERLKRLLLQRRVASSVEAAKTKTTFSSEGLFRLETAVAVVV